MNFVKGKVSGYVKGFVFVVFEEKDVGDVFIFFIEINNVMYGDIVFVRVLLELLGVCCEGIIVKILEWGI